MSVSPHQDLGPWGTRLWLALRERWSACEHVPTRADGVRSLEVSPAAVTGVVAPAAAGRPKVTAVIRRGGATPAAWAAVQALLPLDLDADESPTRTERHLRRLGVELFPRDLRGECSLCGRPASGCSHLAELGFAFARRVDTDPHYLVRFGGWVDRVAPADAAPARQGQRPALTPPPADRPGARVTAAVPPRQTAAMPAPPPVPPAPVQPWEGRMLRALVSAGIIPASALERTAPQHEGDDGPRDFLRRLLGRPMRTQPLHSKPERVANADFWLGGASGLTESPAAGPAAPRDRVDLPLHMQPPPVVVRKLDIGPAMALLCTALREGGERDEASGGPWPVLGWGPEEVNAQPPDRRPSRGE